MPDPHVLFAYKDFRKVQPGISHIGLGVGAGHHMRVLRRRGVKAEVVGVADAKALAAAVAARPGLTHVVVEAPWVPAADLEPLVAAHPEATFAVRAHSNTGFLQADPGACRSVRDVAHLGELAHNLSLAANSSRFCRWFRDAYGARCDLLPNLYDAERHGLRRRRTDPDVVRIGTFGATRALKLHTTAAAAAMLVARRLGRHLELFLNAGRHEGGDSTLPAVRQLVGNLAWARLVEVPWQPWPEFRRTAGSMDLCLQPSATESFNLVTADAAAEGVPSVVSEAIDWVPSNWKAPTDDPEAIARAAVGLLHDPHAGADGIEALQRHNEQALALWMGWIGVAG